MTIIQRAALALFGALSSHKASAAGLSVAALAAAPAFDDVGPFMAGMAAATVVHAYFPPRSNIMALANAVICLALGGLGGPVAVEIAGHYWPWPLGTKAVILASFVLAAVWPWAAPRLWDHARALMAWAVGLVTKTPAQPAPKGGKHGRR